MSGTRQSGITTRQMKEAPRGAIYVWPNNILTYPAMLAKRIGRDDLKICSPSGFTIERVLRDRIEDYVIDHATELPGKGWDALAYINRRKMQDEQNSPHP